ncbi:MAG: 3-deoxy-manno-octulosonate cytidylyltransferase [Candidatus Aminicenantes bacterium]|nr:3-deoxy-manno-octulosonate cytidylyltransferase [Candidatus Aminicenantes bacterium]
MKIAAIIPSRYNSSRFKGKPLVKIKGLTMVERVYRQVEKAGKFSDIIVATDDSRISNVVFRFGGNCITTSEAHNSGTERLWEVLEKSDYDAVVNIQGDEPLVPELLVANLYDELQKGEHPVVTAAYYNTSNEDFLSENVVKVVFDKNNRALYFSRCPVPFAKNSKFGGFFQHIGIYGYTKSAVRDFIGFPGSELEKIESLEQLRFLENGIPIKVILSKEKSFGVDVPDDIIKIEEMLG